MSTVFVLFRYHEILKTLKFNLTKVVFDRNKIEWVHEQSDEFDKLTDEMISKCKESQKRRESRKRKLTKKNGVAEKNRKKKQVENSSETPSVSAPTDKSNKRPVHNSFESPNFCIPNNNYKERPAQNCKEDPNSIIPTNKRKKRRVENSSQPPTSIIPITTEITTENVPTETSQSNDMSRKADVLAHSETFDALLKESLSVEECGSYQFVLNKIYNLYKQL